LNATVRLDKIGDFKEDFLWIQQMANQKKRVRFLQSEYGSYRKEIIEFFSKKIFQPSITILDPMAGNCPLIPFIEKEGGTAYFNDIMPFYYYLNKAKCYKIYSSLIKNKQIENGFLYNEASKCLSSLKKKKLLVSESWIHDEIVNSLIEAWNRTGSYKGPIKDFLRAIIVLCIRPYSCCTRSKTNGLWLKVGGMSTEMPLSKVVKKALNIFFTYYKLNYEHADINPEGRCYFTRKDAASLSMRTKADVIFTSPPYCNRHEPEVTYGPELFFFRAIGEPIGPANIVGTTKVKDYKDPERDLDYIREVAPKTLKFLRWVKKASIDIESQYYLRYYTRYYGSLYRILENVLRMLGVKGRIYIGVQDNIHRGQLNTVGVYVSDFFRTQGMQVTIRFRKLRGHQGLRNISEHHPIVVRKHWEYIIEAKR